MDNQLCFIKEISCAGLIVHDCTEASLLAELASRGYHTLTEQGTGNSGQRKDDDAKRGYNYLLELSMRILTRDKVPPTHLLKSLVMVQQIFAHACPG
jgi:hypothetical protein